MAISVDPDQPFHIVLGGQVKLLTLEGLDQAYQADQMSDATLIWQEGFGEWLRLDRVLAELEAEGPADAPTAGANGDEYHVSFGPTDVRKLSLEQIDDFYRLEVINEESLVWQSGFSEWVPLSALIGREHAPAHVSIAPAPTAQPATPGRGHYSSGPMPGGMGSSVQAGPAPVLPPPSRRPPPPSPRPGMTSSAAASSQPPFASQPPFGAAPTSQPPFASQPPFGAAPTSQPPSGVAPTSQPRSLGGAAGFDHFPRSMAPLSLSMPPGHQPASPWFARSLAVAAAVCALAVTQRNGLAQAAAQGAGSGDVWQGVEASIGGSSVATPQGLERWLAELNDKYGLDELANTDAYRMVAAGPAAPEPGEDEDAAVERDSVGTERGAEPGPNSDSAAPGGGSPSRDALAARMKQGLQGQKAAPKAPTSAARRTNGNTRKTTSSSGLPKSSGLDSYDPMNGSL